MRTLVKSIVLILLLSSYAMNQTVYEFSSRSNGIDARSASLGGATVGESYDVHSMYGNPAALSFLRYSSVAMSTTLGWDKQTLDNTITLPVIMLRNDHVAAISVAGSYYGKTWSNPFFANHGIDAGYSVKLDPTVAIGVLMNVRYGKTFKSNLLAMSGSIGGYYAPSPGISYGLTFDGIGWGMLYKNDDGVSSLTYQRKLQQSIRIGAAFRFPAIYRGPYICISLESQKKIGETGITYRGGIETFPFYDLSLRGGILASPSTTAGTFGIGYAISRFRFDYAVSPSSSVQRFHEVTLSYFM